MPKMSSRGAQFFCSMIVVIGVVVAVIGIWSLAKSIRSEQWPVTDGVIQSAEVKSSPGSKGGTTYAAEVTYTYLVAGTRYTGDKVAIGQMSSSAEYAGGIVNRYPAGKKVSVHYQPGHPAEAVLETGIHGGTWICLGVGTVFTLVGLLFLQIQRAVRRAQLPGAPPSSSVTLLPDGRVGLDKPPVLMGVLFLVVGIGLSFVTPESGKPGWLMYVVGGMFASGGLMLLLRRLENEVYAKIAAVPMVLGLLVVFHWLSFGAGDRLGTVSTPFSVAYRVNVRTPFAIVTILLDVVIVTAWIHSLLPGPFRARHKWKLAGVAGLFFLLAVGTFFFAFNKKARHVRPAGEALFVSTPIDDAFWLKLDRRGSDKYRAQLRAAPPVLVVRESHYAFDPKNGMGMHYGLMDGRMANLHISFSELVAAAYGVDYAHTEFPEAWTRGSWTNCYDVIVTVTNQPQEALQTAAKNFLRQQYGLSWHLETRDAQVLVLRAKDAQLLESKASEDFARSKSIPELASELENYFGQPVLDETGATNRYDETIGDVPSRWTNKRSTDLDFNNQFLATVGLELVSARRPQEWLVLDQ